MTDKKPSAKILADSISPAGVRLTTLEVTFHRYMLAEMNTHRAFSRNSASSRAIPIEKQIRWIKDDPAVPTHWGKNQKGMQAEAELTPKEQRRARKEWLKARNRAVKSAEKLLKVGLHKQVVNRVLEPFMFQTAIITATDFENFFALRIDEHAQHDIRAAAEAMKQAMDESTPRRLGYGDWHLPLVWGADLKEPLDAQIKISAGRCARVSYLTHEGKRDPQADISLHDMLSSNGHMSPLEHQATPYESAIAYSGNLRGWKQYRKTLPNEHDYSLVKP